MLTTSKRATTHSISVYGQHISAEQLQNSRQSWYQTCTWLTASNRCHESMRAKPLMAEKAKLSSSVSQKTGELGKSDENRWKNWFWNNGARAGRLPAPVDCSCRGICQRQPVLDACRCPKIILLRGCAPMAESPGDESPGRPSDGQTDRHCFLDDQPPH